MNSLLDELSEEEVWEQFRAEKIEKNQLNNHEIKQLDSFIDGKRYLQLTDHFSFSYPEKKTITKIGSNKKRTIYAYPADENWVLKLLANKLYRYDEFICDNCYSFRQKKTAKSVFDDIRKIKDIDERYVLKSDIHDYFNSIDEEILINELGQIISDDDRLLSLLTDIISQDKCYFEGELMKEKRGAMAGVPLASFFANIYLKDVDEYFKDEGVAYYRYSDDVIMFFKDEEELNRYHLRFRKMIEDKKLQLNEEKTRIIAPHEKWEYLGFSYKEGKIDLADITVDKMKGKIRRKAHSLYRWRKRKNASYDKTARAFISSFDHKFYDLSGNNAFTWTRFYFPLINCTDGLHEIDEYMLQYLRYLYSGRHYKGNYVITYDHLKKLGYTPLVAEYYRWIEENRKLNEMK